jgi:hypothetical protein
MFRTMSISKAITRSQGIVLHGTLYLSNNPINYDAETRELVNKVMRLIEVFTAIETYEEKLQMWLEQGLYMSEYWIGDTSRLVEGKDTIKYSGHPQPEPDYLLTIVPTNYSQIIDLNICNIKSNLMHIGSFELHQQQYLKNLSDHVDSPFYERKLVIDLQIAENELYSFNSIGGWYGISGREWYDSFVNKNDTLIKKDYEIWDLHQSLASLPLLSNKNKQRLETPYLFYLIDTFEDVAKAAKGYFLHQQIPFLRKLREESIKITIENGSFSNLTTKENIITSSSDTNASGSETPTLKKSKKKEQQLTTKQQMILLNALGFLDASIIKHLSNKHKAAVLAQLLRRSSQEIRCMLTYWDGINVPKDYDCTNPDDLDKVVDLLSDNNLQFPNL